MFIGYKTLLKLVILYIEEFDIIFEVRWLSPYYVILDCYAKFAIMVMIEMEKLV